MKRHARIRPRPGACSHDLLRRLEIQAFKAFDHEVVDVEPFSVLVGRNGSGKTSVLQAVEFFHGLVAGTLGDHLAGHGWEYKDLPRLKSPNFEFGFGAVLDLADEVYWWRVRLGKRRRSNIASEQVLRVAPDRRDAIARGIAAPDASLDTLLMSRTGRRMRRFDATAGEWESVTQTLTSSWLSAVDLKEDRKRFPGLVALADWARRIEPYVVLDPNRLREPSRLSSTGIGPAGERLAGFLRHLRSRKPEAFQRVESRVRSAYPRLDDVEIQTHNGTAFTLAVRESWAKEGNPLLNARQASDGLLRLFAFAAMPELTPRPSLLMVDELENGVHPELLGAVVALLEELAADEQIQVLATSHSPVVLNYVSSPSSVLLTVRDAEGRADTVPLDETKGFEQLSSAFDTGEMWLSVGEQGLIEGPRQRAN